MRSDLTDITIVRDRSGSMASQKADADGGLKTFIEEQKKAAGDARLTIIDFNNRSEVVVESIPIQDAGEYPLHPQGGTALLDALGRAIDNAGSRLAGMKEEDRPGMVVFVVITDGQENSSTKYTKAAIKQKIEHQQGKYSWKFIFMGANQDSFLEAQQLGIYRGTVADYANPLIGYTASAQNVSAGREMLCRGVVARNVSLDFADSQRDKMVSH